MKRLSINKSLDKENVGEMLVDYFVLVLLMSDVSFWTRCQFCIGFGQVHWTKYFIIMSH